MEQIKENSRKKIYPKIVRGAFCFVKNTKIYTPNGYINIDKIKVGDKVYCFDKNLKIRISEVEKTFRHKQKEVIDVYFDDKKIRTTSNHPFLNQNNEFIEIGNFTSEDYLIDRFNKKIKIKKIKIIKKFYDVYNFTVKKYHTYIAEDLLVHNKGGGPPPCYPSPPPDPHTPREETEGLLGKTSITRAISRTETEVTDLICEGPIEGLVSGKYNYVGRVGTVGWDSASFTSYPGGYLQSVFWRNVPVVDENGKYNYSSINFMYDYGNQVAPRTLQSNLQGNKFLPNATRTLSIGDILKYGPGFKKSYDFKSTDVSNFIVAIKIDSLFEQQNNPNSGRQDFNLGCGQVVKISQTLGDIKDRDITYNIKIIKLTTSGPSTVISENKQSKGKISSGFIDTFTFDLSPYFKADEKTHLGWRVQIERTKQDSTVLSLRDSCSVHSITEIFSEQYIYPKVAIFKNLFTTDYFQDVPSRSYDTKLLKVKVPSNYDPIKKSYTGDWDGTFSSELKWTDNPVWCYYDLLTNSRYGLGKYIESYSVDKWNLYKISRYCDTLVSDGYGGLEPRFTCNAIINDFSDAFNLLNDFASIFRGMSYYANGSIYAIADIPQSPFVLFTNANVENGDFNYSSSSKKVRNSIAVVRYNDMNNFAKPVVEYVEDPDAIRKYGIRKLELTAFGCTSRGQAYRLGRWALASEQLETETVDFVAGLDALYLKPGDLIKIQDSNRVLNRLGGRVLDISLQNGNHSFVLDAEYSKINSYISSRGSNQFNFEILTPTYRVAGTNYSDFVSSYERPEIQSGTFSLSNMVGAVGYDPEKTLVKLNTNKVFDSTNYILQTGAIWTINVAVGATNNQDLETELYRVIGLTELEGNKYNINAIEHNPSKYLFVESGISLTDAPPIVDPGTTQLEASYPSSLNLSLYLDLYLKYIIGKPISTIGYGTSFWKVYAKAGSDFTSSDLSRQLVSLKGISVLVPNQSFLIETVNVTDNENSIESKFIPTQNDTTYYFRIYGLSPEGYYSRNYTSQSFYFSSATLKDLSNILIFNDFKYDDENGVNSVVLNAANLFAGSSFNFNWSLQNLAPTVKDFNNSDLTYRLTFGTGTFNSATAGQNTIRQYNININEIDSLLASTGISSDELALILKDYSMSGFWLAIDAKEKTGVKYTSQTSISAAPYTQINGYVQGYFYNNPIVPRMNFTNSVGSITTNNNIYISAQSPKDIGNGYVFFTDQISKTGLLTTANINAFLTKATKQSNYDIILDLYNNGIQLREAFSDGNGNFTTSQAVFNSTAPGSVLKSGWGSFRFASNFEENLINRYSQRFSDTGVYNVGPGSSYIPVNYGSLPIGISQVYKWNNSSDDRNVFNNLMFLNSYDDAPILLQNNLDNTVSLSDLSGCLRRDIYNTGTWYIAKGTSSSYANLTLDTANLTLQNNSTLSINSESIVYVGSNISPSYKATINLLRWYNLYDYYGGGDITFSKGIGSFRFNYDNYASGGYNNGGIDSNPNIKITSGVLEMNSGLIGIDDISIHFYKRSGIYHNYPAGTPANNPNGKIYARILASPTSGLYVSGKTNITDINITGVTGTSATAGTASALPTLPRGYLSTNIGGTAVKIPYYS
jgi:hypothetical protein